MNFQTARRSPRALVARIAARIAAMNAVSFVAMLVAQLLVSTAPAVAQSYDHLKCFKIRDEKTFASATVDLDALVAEFGLQECTVKGRAKTLCVPVDKNVTSISGGTTTPVGGDEIAQSRLCYKLSCPASVVADQVVTDQFGSRTVSGFKAVQLCTPVQAPAPTTTTSTTTTTLVEELDDDFSGGSLDPSWSVLHPSLVTISVSGGALHLTPTTAGGGNVWYNAGEGPLVYKEVTGNFDVTTTITTRDSSMIGNPPPPEYRLAGILARDPASSPASSNTVHVALGAGADAQGTCYEYKSTDDSLSNWLATPTASASGQLRLRRLGSTFEMYWRAVALDSWLMIQSFNRPDLPATLQVGPMIYSVEGPPLIEALFDDIVFQ